MWPHEEEPITSGQFALVTFRLQEMDYGLLPSQETVVFTATEYKLPKRLMGVAVSQLLLKMIFYLTAGVILASISWSTISHSRVTRDYALTIILLGAMFFIVGMFAVSSRRHFARTL